MFHHNLQTRKNNGFNNSFQKTPSEICRNPLGPTDQTIPVLSLLNNISFDSADNNTYVVRVLSDLSTCGHLIGKVNDKDTQTGGKGGAGNIAVTIASVCAAVGLIVAAVIVCLKCRRAPLTVKKRPSK